jgi:membrane-bound lytic murein transglycosylase A
LAFLLASFQDPAAGEPMTRQGPGESRLDRRTFADLPGWQADDHQLAFSVFRRSCLRLVAAIEPLRPAQIASAEFVAVCQQAAALTGANGKMAREFFERNFVPWRVNLPEGRAGFLTGYYEPEVEASATRTAAFPHPLLARPPLLVSIEPGKLAAAPELSSAFRQPDGELVSTPDRAAIEAGALAGAGLELAFVRDEVEAFFIHVQGSARLRFPDGRIRKLTYAGRNGHAYTSIGRIVIDEGHLTREEMSLERFKSWLRANPARAAEIMRRNRSFVFFAWNDALRPEDGPIGGAGVSLIAMRSIAIDRRYWAYGTPFFMEAALPMASDQPISRLVVAQDTGSAILGPARADLFYGSGDAAGHLAGLTRHPATFHVLLPRQETAP